MFTKTDDYVIDPTPLLEAPRYGEKGGACFGKVSQVEAGHTGDGSQARRCPPGQRCNPGGRNPRNVWAIPTKGYKGAHFAVFPKQIPLTCIKATPKACCIKCLWPYAPCDHYGPGIGFLPTCDCKDSNVAMTNVLDPFMGSGTTLIAAHELARHATGIELSLEYIKVAKQRIKEETGQDAPCHTSEVAGLH
jgi:hypothetical protein